MSRQTEIQELIIKHHRRLQKLKEKKATLGINTPPEILTEIEDIEAEVEHLQEDLKVLEQQFSSDTPNSFPEKFRSNAIKEERKSPVEILVAKVGLSGTIIASLIGLVGVGITAYFGYLGIQTQINAPIEATQTAEAKLTILAFSVTPTTLASTVSTNTSTPELTHSSTPTPIPSDTPTSTGTATSTPSNMPTSTGTAASTPTKTPGLSTNPPTLELSRILPTHTLELKLTDTPTPADTSNTRIRKGHIVFTSRRDGNSEIYMMNSDGSGQTNLTNNPSRDGASCLVPRQHTYSLCIWT